MAPVPFSRVSAFTSIYSSGNPAGVTILPPDSTDDDTYMSTVAIEMQMAETAFVRQLGSNKNEYSIRWFCAPSGHEEHLCGHATLASAHTLYTQGYADPAQPIHFKSKYSGSLYASQCQVNGATGYQLTFPAKPETEKLDIASLPDSLLAALDIKRADIVNVAVHNPDVVIEVKSTDVVLAINTHAVKYDHLKTYTNRRGFLVTAHNTSKKSYQGVNNVDIVSRCLFGLVGEDPVTGSAHCAISVYWANKLNQHGRQFTCFQASPRGGILYVEWDEKENVVKLQGTAVTVIKGELLV